MAGTLLEHAIKNLKKNKMKCRRALKFLIGLVWYKICMVMRCKKS